MTPINTFLLFALIGAVCCKTFPLDINGKSSTSSEEDQQVNIEYIRSVDIFKSKVASRLDASHILASQPDIKLRLLDIALSKFKSCETSSLWNHSCLGFATGQAMSLIAAYEKNQAQQLLDSEN